MKRWRTLDTKAPPGQGSETVLPGIGTAGAADAHVLALVDETPIAGCVLTAAKAIADLLAIPVVAAHAGLEDPTIARATGKAGLGLTVLAGDPVPTLRKAAEAGDVELVVLGARQHTADPRPAGHVAQALLVRVNKPLLVVGPRCRVSALERFGRLLVPLDGTDAATAAVRRTVDLFGRSGLDIVALHVFDPDTVPAFFDQPQHGYREFIARFLDRHLLHPSARLTLGSGDPGLGVIRAVTAEAADIVALGWSQQLQAGRARVIRRLLADSDIPILMLPTSACRPRRSEGLAGAT